MDNLKDLRISNENKLEFKKKGWTLVDLKLSQKSINNSISGLKEMKKYAIKKNYKPKRIYYDHLFSNNLAAIELPFNKAICNKKVRDFFKEAKIGSLVRNLMDWKNPCCDLSRLFCMGNYKYRGNWHRDYDSNLENIQADSHTRDIVLVGIYLLPQQGFRILNKNYEYKGKNSIVATKRIDKAIRSFPFPLAPKEESYSVINGMIGTALFFDPFLLHQGSNYDERFDFHMKFYKSKKGGMKRNKFQDFSVIDILHENCKLSFDNDYWDDSDLSHIPIQKRSTIMQRLSNTIDYRTCLRRILKIKSLKENQDYIYLKNNGWDLDFFSNTIFQK